MQYKFKKSGTAAVKNTTKKIFPFLGVQSAIAEYKDLW
jgi:hypothetical protein